MRKKRHTIVSKQLTIRTISATNKKGMHEWTTDGSGGQRTAAEDTDNGRQRRTRATDGSGGHGQRTAAQTKDGGGGQRTAAADNERQRQTTSVSGGLKAADNRRRASGSRQRASAADKGRQRQTTSVGGRQQAADNRRRGTPLASVAGHRHQFVEENRYSQMQMRVTTYCSGSGWGPIFVWVRGFRRGCRRGRWPGG